MLLAAALLRSVGETYLSSQQKSASSVFRQRPTATAVHTSSVIISQNQSGRGTGIEIIGIRSPRLSVCVSLSLKSLLLCSQFSRSAAELYRKRRAFSRVMQSVSKFALSPSNPLCCETRQAWRSGGAAVARSGSERCAFLCCGAFSVSISLPWHWREQSGETHVVFREGEHAQWALHWREKVASEARICGFACY